MSRRLKAASFGLFALFALLALAGARAAFAQDAGTSDASDANWERVDADSSSDTSADSPDQVLEIPQVACGEDVSIPCDERADAGNSPDDDDGGIPVASGESAPAAPQTFDDDTADAGSADANSEWGNADDYANQTVYGFPYGAAQYGGVGNAPVNGNLAPLRRQAGPFSPMQTSSPITQAAMPPLNIGHPWMTRTSMSMYSRPAGSPMAGAPFRFH